MSLHIPQKVLDRVWERIDSTGGEQACWLWTGPVGASGYGNCGWTLGGQAHTTTAHRAAWTSVHGPIADGLHLDHLCRERSCCNPLHLEPVTCRENILRGTAPAAINARKTHCIRGHEFTAENTVVHSGGKRMCRTCKKARENARNRRLRERRAVA